MKVIIKIIFIIFFYIVFLKEISFSYEINDIGNVYKNINEIEGYEGNFLNNDLGFLGNNYLFLGKDGKTVYGYFDENKKTVVRKVNIDFLFKLGFLGKANSFSGKIIDFNVIKGYFDENKKTIITKKYPDYNFYLGFLGNIKIDKVNIKVNKKKKIKQQSFRFILGNYIRLNTTVYALENHVKLKDYNKFIYNLLDFIFEGKEGKIYIGDDIEKLKIEIAKTDFLNKIKVLILKSKEINNGFNINKSEIKRKFIIDYYLK